MGMMLRRSKQVPKQVPADPHAPTIVSPLEHVQRAHEAERQAHEKTKGELEEIYLRSNERIAELEFMLQAERQAHEAERQAHEAERQAHEKTKGELDAATKLIEQTTAPTKQEQPAAHAAAIPAAMADKKGKKQ